MLYSESKDYDNCSYFCVFMTANCNNMATFHVHQQAHLSIFFTAFLMKKTPIPKSSYSKQQSLLASNQIERNRVGILCSPKTADWVSL